MNLIEHQIIGTSRASDNGLLERIESNPRRSAYDMLALITRCANLLERDDYIIERLEDDQYIAFNALDILRGRLSDCISDDETGRTEERAKEDAVRNYHDQWRYD